MEPEKIDFFQLTVRQRMSPFPNYLSMESISEEMRDILGTAYNHIMLIFKENLLYGFFDRADFERVGSYALKKILENPQFFRKIVEIVDKAGKDFVKWIKSISEKSTSKYTNEQLADLHKEYEKKYRFIYSHYFTILTVERKLAEYLKSYLKKKVSDPQLIEDYFSVLITEPRAQVNGREQYAALKLAKKIVENEKWRKHFSNNNEKEVESAVRKDPELNKLFEEHEKGYFWITRDYEDPVLTYSDFVNRMMKILKEKPLEKLAEKSKALESVDKNIRGVEKKAGIDSHHSQLFQAMREGIHLKELRKAYVSQSLYYYDPILKEIVKRSHISLRAIRHIKTEEVPSVFTDEKLQEELSKRVRLSIFFVDKGKTKVYTGKRAESLYKDICLAKQDFKELKGMPASPGIASGIVRIVMNPDELHKVEQGGIIVSGQIVPSFAPALKKAAGLVCDGGTGITSHPAILAREAKIPAVTSTNIATQVLKDGDIVEVDGYKGIVKKIKK